MPDAPAVPFSDLSRRATYDQHYRNMSGQGAGLTQAQMGHAMRMDKSNTSYLTGQVVNNGWPSDPVQSQQAWLLAQHSDHSPVQQASLLHHSRQSPSAKPRDLAYLQDRVLVNSRKPQQFGTQGSTRWTGKAWEPWRPHPVAEPGGLAARRATAGLPPPQAQLKTMQDLTAKWPAPAPTMPVTPPLPPRRDSPNLSPLRPWTP